MTRAFPRATAVVFLAVAAVLWTSPATESSAGTQEIAPEAGSIVQPASGALSGYDILDDLGAVYTKNSPWYGSLLTQNLSAPIVSMAIRPKKNQKGYWLVNNAGSVFSFGGAKYWGSTSGISLTKSITGIAPTATGKGYWLVGGDGGIFAFGDASYYGSTGGLHLTKRIVDIASTPDGLGYWLVARDGGIFAFGDAPFYGSTGALHLNQPIVGMSSTSTGRGYRFVASDGGIFSFGDAAFLGSTGGMALAHPVVGLIGA